MFSKDQKASTTGDNSPILQIRESNIEIHNEINSNALADKISDKMTNSFLEMQSKDEEIRQLKNIIAKLQNNSEDERIKKYIEDGDYVEASNLIRESLEEDGNKLFERELLDIEVTSLYSFEESTTIINKLLQKYKDNNIYTVRLTLSYADILLRYGKINEAQEKYILMQKLSKFKVHFFQTEDDMKYIKFGITKSDGSQIDNIENFSLKNDKDYLDLFMSLQNLLFASNGLAQCFIAFGLYQKAYEASTKSLKYALISQDKDLIEYTKASFAFIHYILGDYNQAIEYYNDVKDESPHGIIKLQILTHIYANRQNINELEKVIKKIKKVFESLDLKENKFYNKAGYYESLGKYYLTLQEYKKAEIYYLKAIEINKSRQQIKALADIYPHLAELYKIMGEIDKVKYYYEQTIKLATKHNFYGILTLATYHYALTESNVYEKIKYLKKSLFASKKIERLSSLALNLNMLAEQFRQLKQYKKANKYMHNAIDLFKTINQTQMIYYDVYYDLMKLERTELKDYFCLVKLSNRCNNSYKKYDAYMNLSEYYMHKSNLKQALKALYRAEAILNSCKSCKDIDRFYTYAYIFQMYLNLKDYKNYHIYMQKASQFANEKKHKLSLEVFKMIFLIQTKSNLNDILALADNISLNFSSMEKGHIEQFFKSIYPIVKDNKLYDLGFKYTERFLPIVNNKSFDEFEQEEAIILLHIGVIYTKIFLETSYLDTWTKAVSYLQVAIYFFQTHIEKNEENFSYTINTALNLAMLYTIVNNKEEAVKIYEIVYDNNRISDDFWETESFRDNKTLYYSGMVNYASNLRLDKSFDKAIEISKKNIKLLEQSTDLEHLELALSNLALVYEDMELYVDALIYHVEALKQGEKAQNFFAIAYAHEHIGRIYKIKQDYNLSNKHFDKAIYAYRKIDSKENVEKINKLKGLL